MDDQRPTDGADDGADGWTDASLPASPAPTALPSALARFLAFAAIIVAGVCGGLIGFSVIDLQCDGDCTTATVLGALAGTLIAAGGVAIIAVLVLRAMAEWETQG